jgi:hypothetical protein
MTLHIEFANCWPMIILAALVITPLTVIYISSIMRNEVTRVGIAHKDTSFWLESRRSPKNHPTLLQNKPTRKSLIE